MKMIVKEIVFILRSVFFLPHLLLFSLSDNKKLIIEDVRSMAKHMKCARGVYSMLLFLLIYDKYFRTLFYCRIGVWSHLVSWYAPKSETFFPCSNMGEGIYLAHPYATILNAKSIGNNFTCRQCTTIGNKRDGDNDNLPIIGNNVTLGANVVIIGNVSIGDNVIIGAGSVVVKDVPSNCIVAGNPARVIRKNVS